MRQIESASFSPGSPMKHETLALFVVISVGSPVATHYLSSMRLFEKLPPINLKMAP
jgi:hypothetical protein